MRRLLLVLALALMLLSARAFVSVTLQAGDSAHCTGDALVQTGVLDAYCVAFTATPTLTLWLKFTRLVGRVAESLACSNMPCHFGYNFSRW